MPLGLVFEFRVTWVTRGISPQLLPRAGCLPALGGAEGDQGPSYLKKGNQK
jgi:hypothetical protein